MLENNIRKPSSPRIVIALKQGAYMTPHTTNKSLPILSVKSLLDKAGQFSDHIGSLDGTCAPADVEKYAKAMAELYKTANLVQTFNAQEAERKETADYDTFPAPTPEQEAKLRDELLGYYERIHGEQVAGGDVDEGFTGKAKKGFPGDVAPVSP